MELMSAIRFEPFEKVKKIAESIKTLKGSEYLDYHALNLALALNRKRTIDYLISKKCRVNMEIKKLENTPLHNAIEFTGNEQIVCDLLMKKASVLAVNHEGNTPLHMAFLKRYDRITELILNVMFVHNFYEYTNIKNKQGLTHMHIACTIDNERLVQLFLNAGANIEDAVNKESPYYPGYTAMHFAVKNNCIEVAKILMDAGGTNIISQGTDGENRSPVRLAFENLNNLQVLFYHMTMQNIDNQWGYKHLSQFHVACLSDYPELVQKFVMYGAAINTPLQQEAAFCPGYTPLHCAVESNCKENVEILLEKGANVDQLNHYNMTALHLALYNENPKEQNTIVDLLYAALKDKKRDILDLNGLGYMHIAVTRDDKETVKMFLKNDKNIVNHAVMYNLRNFSGFTPLHFAVKYKHLEMASLLIRNGADVNSNDDFEHGTPLHLAFETGHRQLIDFLLEKGARADISRAADDKTMLHLLVEYYMDQTEARELVEFANVSGEANFFQCCDAKDDMLEYIERLVSLGCNINAIESEDGSTALHLACQVIWNGANCIKKLLEFGADINIEDFYEQTAFQLALNSRYSDNGDDYMMFYHHIQKLKALELQVNVKNEKCCEEILKKKETWETYTSVFPHGVNYFSDEELERKHQERLEEITRMKDFKLDQKISLYDFARFQSNLAAAYVHNKPLVKLFEEKDTKELNEKYPSYAYLIKLRYRKAVEYFVLNNGSLKKSCSVVAKKTRRGVQLIQTSAMPSLRITLAFTVIATLVVLAKCGSISLGAGEKGEIELELKHPSDRLFKWKWGTSKDLLVRTYAVKEGKISRLLLIDMYNLGSASAKLLTHLGTDTVKIRYSNDGKHRIKFLVRAFGFKGSKPYHQFAYNS